MSYKLNPNLVPLLTKRADGVLVARLAAADHKNAVIELSDGVQVTVKLTELGVKLGKSFGAELEFDAAGVLTKFTLDTPPAQTKTASTARSGSAQRRNIPQF